MPTYNASLLEVGCHDNDFHTVLPAHPPEVFDSVVHGSLGGNVLAGVVLVALQGRGGTEMRRADARATGSSIMPMGRRQWATHPDIVAIDIVRVGSPKLQLEWHSCLGC